MIKTRAGNWTVLAAMLLCVSACGKKDDATPAPVLPVPQAVEKITPAAEVKASSGPIELSLLVRETQIRAGDYIWEQIRIRNIGDKEIIVSDPIFFKPRELLKQSNSRYGIYLEAIGPNGKPVKVQYPTPARQGNDLVMDRVSGFLEVKGPEEKAMVDGWKKQGLSLREINSKLLDFNIKKHDEAAARNDRSDPLVALLPGQSAETKYAFFQSVRDKIYNRPIPRPAGEYARVDFFALDTPGEYKIRAVYDRAPTPELNRLRGKLPIYPEEVLVRTPWIKVTVMK